MLPNKVAVLDKITRISHFAENAVSVTELALDLGESIAEVRPIFVSTDDT